MLSQTGARPDPLAIGRKLGVDLLLEGWVQRADNRIRVTIQLVDAHDGSSLWSEKFDALFTDIFDVQDKISEQVTRALMLKLSGEERKRLTKRHTENSEAYRLYLKGRYFWNKRLVEGLKKAGDYFQSATELDPDYALAYVGLADCYNMLSFFSGFSPKEFYPKARECDFSKSGLSLRRQRQNGLGDRIYLCGLWSEGRSGERTEAITPHGKEGICLSLRDCPDIRRAWPERSGAPLA